MPGEIYPDTYRKIKAEGDWNGACAWDAVLKFDGESIIKTSCENRFLLEGEEAPTPISTTTTTTTGTTTTTSNVTTTTTTAAPYNCDPANNCELSVSSVQCISGFRVYGVPLPNGNYCYDRNICANHGGNIMGNDTNNTPYPCFLQ